MEFERTWQIGKGNKRRICKYILLWLFPESINPEDLIIDVDNTLAKQLYKKWEKTVQVEYFKRHYSEEELAKLIC